MSANVSAASQLRINIDAAWAIAKKDMRIYYLKPPPIMFGIMFPFVIFFSFAIGRNVPAITLLPGLLSITILFSASSIGPMVIPTERRVRTFERLRSAPISAYSVTLGKILSGFLFSIAVAIIPLIIGLTWLAAQIVSVSGLVLGVILPAFCFATLGILFAMLPTENPGDIMMVLNVVRLPLIFISGLFIPLESLPTWGQAVAAFSPLTYANDLVTYAFQGKTVYGVLVDSLVLLIFTGAFLLLSARLERKFKK